MNAPDVLDLFAGPGGWSQGLRTLGITDIGVEWDRQACATRAAAGHVTVRADVAQLATAPMRGRIRHLIASPPCQVWTAAGKRAGEVDRPLARQAVQDLAAGRDTRDVLRAACRDPRSLLAAEPMRWIHDLRPDSIALEEVPAVLPLWEQYATVLRGWGYSVWCGVLNAADYGVPQTRRRAILAASRVRDVAPPAPTHAQHPRPGDLFTAPLLPWVTMADALPHRTGQTLLNRRDSPAWIAAHGPRRNRPASEPAPTITGEAHRWYWSNGDRLTIAEAAVLQGFPAGLAVHGPRTAQFLQIGNAVPPAAGRRRVHRRGRPHRQPARHGRLTARHPETCMSADTYTAINCDGPDCDNATHLPVPSTATEVRRERKADGWHTRPKGRDICPDCWTAGHR